MSAVYKLHRKSDEIVPLETLSRMQTIDDISVFIFFTKSQFLEVGLQEEKIRGGRIFFNLLRRPGYQTQPNA